jgi:hypothetical protein
MKTTRAIITGLALLTALPVAAQEMFFYPTRGQSAEQQNTDRGECHVWAVQQSGFDPANPSAHATTQPVPPPQGGPVRGAARGAALGAVGGAIAGDAGRGAAAGAGVGALAGTMRRGDQQQQQTASQQQHDAQFAQQRNNFNRALAACMQGRGYSIN